MIERKQPGEKLVYEYDFAEKLGDATIDEVLLVENTARYGETALTNAAQATTSTSVKVAWSGGEDGEAYDTSVRVRDTAAQIHEIDGTIEVRERPYGGLISVDEVKEHLKIEVDDEDALLDECLAAAIGSIDGPNGWLGRSLTRQTIVQRFDRFPCEAAKLSYPPIESIDVIEYADSNGAWHTVDANLYELDDGWLRLAFGASWPICSDRAGAVRVTYTAGYTRLPKPIRAATLLMVGDLYRFRETAVIGTIAAEIPMSATVTNLLAPYRVFV